MRFTMMNFPWFSTSIVFLLSSCHFSHGQSSSKCHETTTKYFVNNNVGLFQTSWKSEAACVLNDTILIYGAEEARKDLGVGRAPSKPSNFMVFSLEKFYDCEKTAFRKTTYEVYVPEKDVGADIDIDQNHGSISWTGDARTVDQDYCNAAFDGDTYKYEECSSTKITTTPLILTLTLDAAANAATNKTYHEFYHEESATNSGIVRERFVGNGITRVASLTSLTLLMDGKSMPLPPESLTESKCSLSKAKADVVDFFYCQ